MKFGSSIKTKAVLLLMIVMIVPIIIVGTISSAYFQEVIRANIWENNLAQAKATSILTTNYFDSAFLYLESQAASPPIIDSISSANTAGIYDTIEHIQNISTFSGIYVTDREGTVISSFPEDIVGQGHSDKPWVGEVLRGNNSYVSDAIYGLSSNQPAVFMSAPIKSNNTTIGVMVGVIDLAQYSDLVLSTQVQNRQYIFLVNRSGNAMVHSNASYTTGMQNLSALPAVREVIQGRQGETEQYNPYDNNNFLVAYSPVQKYGWGAIVSLPGDVAYDPVRKATTLLGAVIAVIIFLSILIAGLVGRYIADPIIDITSAAGQMPHGTYRKALPLDREDEIGSLARALDRMAADIQAKQEELIKARDHAEEEKMMAELYVDLMGHDINNLNQTTLASLELMEDAPNLTQEQRSFIRKAMDSTRGSAGIIENVGKIQQITTGKIQKEKVDLDDLLDRCILESHRPAEKNVEIRYQSRPGMIVTGTPLLKEVFCNLIGNSIKYSGTNVTIEITAEEIVDRNARYYQITIADNGHGIPDEVKPRLFRRFERGTTKAHGKGLGLYIVRMLVEQSGGTVDVRDRVPGDYAKGAKFIVRLPAE